MDRAQIARNALLFDSFLRGHAAQREFHRSVVKNGKKFVALIELGRILFIPGHYAVVPLDQLRFLHQKQTVPAAEVDRILGRLCGAPVSPGEPLYQAIDAYHVEYCALSGDRPSAHHQSRTYWLMRR